MKNFTLFALTLTLLAGCKVNPDKVLYDVLANRNSHLIQTNGRIGQRIQFPYGQGQGQSELYIQDGYSKKSLSEINSQAPYCTFTVEQVTAQHPQLMSQLGNHASNMFVVPDVNKTITTCVGSDGTADVDLQLVGEKVKTKFSWCAKGIEGVEAQFITAEFELNCFSNDRNVTKTINMGELQKIIYFQKTWKAPSM